MGPVWQVNFVGPFIWGHCWGGARPRVSVDVTRGVSRPCGRSPACRNPHAHRPWMPARQAVKLPDTSPLCCPTLLRLSQFQTDNPRDHWILLATENKSICVVSVVSEQQSIPVSRLYNINFIGGEPHTWLVRPLVKQDEPLTLKLVRKKVVPFLHCSTIRFFRPKLLQVGKLTDICIYFKSNASLVCGGGWLVN